jgi:hypothetical protein
LLTQATSLIPPSPPLFPPSLSTYGATSALSVIVGSLGTFGTGVILDNLHEWPYVFGIAAGVYVAGAVAFASLYKAEKIFD